MSRSSGRGQTEPLVALVAVFAVCLGVTLYAFALDDASGGTERDVATPTLDRVLAELSSGGVVDPDRLDAAVADVDAELSGRGVAATLRVADRSWRAGGRPTADARTAERRVAVRIGPGHVRGGRLSVEVWS